MDTFRGLLRILLPVFRCNRYPLVSRLRITTLMEQFEAYQDNTELHLSRPHQCPQRGQ